MPLPRHIAVTAALILALPGIVGFAGPLDPPPGPITPTAKPLEEIEPRIPISSATTPGDADSLFRIAQPGSYYLTGAITGVAARSGIEIAANGVTLDLNGFELLGVPGSLDGITSSGSIVNTAIRNGSIRAWGSSGIDLNNSTTSIISDLRVQGNGDFGIGGGGHAIITRCIAASNGIDGIGAGIGGAVSHCHASANGDDGIDVGSQSLITACFADSNVGEGIECSIGVTVTGCSTSENSGSGIDASSGCTITGCTAYSNDGDGINASGSSTIAYNTVRNGQNDGIQTGPNSHVFGNLCAGNGLDTLTSGAGIHITGSETRIEGNNCASNTDFGIRVVAGGNIIIRNTVSGSVDNWSISPDNYYGPIINRENVLTPGIVGDAAASTLATTDPNANFTY